MRKLLSFLMAFFFIAPIFFGSCEKMTEDFYTGDASIEVARKYKMVPVIDTLYQTETVIQVDTVILEQEGKTDTLIIRDTIKVPEYVPVIKIDTVYVRDTITNTITDTVYKERVVYDTTYVEKTKIDTMFINKTDTLYVDVEVEIEKPIYIRDTVKIEVVIRDTTYILPDGAYYGKPYVGGKETAYLPEFIFVDGVHVETNLIPAKFTFLITAGNPILVGATPALVNNEAAVNNNTFSYLYYAGSNVFDSWMVEFNREVTFVTSDGKTIKHTLTENWEPMSLAYYRSSDLTWDHLSAATINNIIQDTDVQQLYMMPKSPEYTFAHEHKTSKVLTAEMQIRDTHNGIVLENGKAVERAAYNALHQVSHSQSNAIEYNSISSVENRVFTLDNGVARIANATVVEDVKLIECDNLYMETTETWYCHPAFPTSGAEAVLGCCQPEAIRLKTGKYNGNYIPATLIVKGEQEKEFPIVLTTEAKPVVQPDVHGVEFDNNATVIGANQSQLIAYPTINGKRTGETVKLTSNFSGTLKAGAQINKTSNGSVNLSNTNASVSGNNASFTYSLNGTSFADAWTLSTQANATFTYDKNGVKETVTKPIKTNVTVKSTQFAGTNGTYRNTASLYADGFAIASDTQVIVVNKPDVHGVEFDNNATVIGVNQSQLIAYPTINGKRTGETVKLTSNFSGTLKAGAQINKTSNGSVNLNNTNASVSGNNASFNYSLDGASFSDTWSWNTQANATFTYDKNGVKETVTKSIKTNVTVKSTQFTGTNGTYRNTASLYADGFAIASDTQVIVVNKPDVHGVEFDNNATVIGANQSQLIAYPTINGKRTGETVKLTSNFSGTLKAGAQINKTSNGSVNLSNTNASVSGNNASFNYSLDGASFSDTWSWNTQANATFTYDKNGVKETVTKPIKANVTVKSTQFTGTNGTYRNTASLYADGFAIASDVQVIVVNKPQASLIEGYTVIAAYITTCYHKGSNDAPVNDGNHMAIVARKNNDASKYIIRRANATTGEKIEDYNVNNVDEEKVFSFRTVEGKMKPAYLDVLRINNEADSWAYQDISSFNPDDSSTYFAISKWYVINYRYADPLIEVGKVENGYVTINGLRFK